MPVDITFWCLLSFYFTSQGLFQFEIRRNRESQDRVPCMEGSCMWRAFFLSAPVLQTDSGGFGIPQGEEDTRRCVSVYVV
jgi:hypothetical protein